MAYQITKNSTEADLKKAKEIFEKLNKNSNTTPSQKLENDKQLEKLEKAQKQLKACISHYKTVYPINDKKYISGNEAIKCIADLETAINKYRQDKGLSPDFSVSETEFSVDSVGYKSSSATASVVRSFFTGEDGKFAQARCEKAAIGVAAAGLVVNPTVGPWVLTAVKTVLTALWGFSPLTAIGLGLFAALKVKKLVSPIVTKYKQRQEELHKVNEELYGIGKPEEGEENKKEKSEVDKAKGEIQSEFLAAYTAKQQKLANELHAAAASIPVSKDLKARQADFYQLYDEIKDSKDLTEETKKQLLDQFKTISAQDENGNEIKAINPLTGKVLQETVKDADGNELKQDKVVKPFESLVPQKEEMDRFKEEANKLAEEDKAAAPQEAAQQGGDAAQVEDPNKANVEKVNKIYELITKIAQSDKLSPEAKENLIAEVANITKLSEKVTAANTVAQDYTDNNTADADKNRTKKDFMEKYKAVEEEIKKGDATTLDAINKKLEEFKGLYSSGGSYSWEEKGFTTLGAMLSAKLEAQIAAMTTKTQENGEEKSAIDKSKLKTAQAIAGLDGIEAEK